MWTLPFTKNGIRKNEVGNSNGDHALIELRKLQNRCWRLSRSQKC